MILVGIDFTDNGFTHEEEHSAAMSILKDILKSCGDFSIPEGYAKTPEGKPYFENCPITFSLSHTDRCVACAVSVPNEDVLDGEVFELEDIITECGICRIDCTFPCELGIDVELIDRERSHDRMEAISKRYFSAAECAKLSAATDKALEFYRIWTAKESYVKCTGAGMKAIAATDTENITDGYRINRFILKNRTTEYSASVCVKPIK